MVRNLSLVSFMVLAACGSARVIQRTQTGGVVELSGDRGKAMEAANQDMAAHCGPNNFTIVQEGEEPVGTDTYTADQSHQTRNGGERTTEQTSTRTATAWRVHYQCNGAGGPPPMGAAPGGPGGPPPGGDPNGGAPPPPAGGGY